MHPSRYRERSYRNRVQKAGLTAFRVQVNETDLHVQAAFSLEDLTRELVLRHRGHIEAFMASHPGFAAALEPWSEEPLAPPVVRDMIDAGRRTGTGPMAAVAGAIAERVGRGLLERSPEVIVENGGDIFLKVGGPLVVALFAGESPLSLRMGLRLDPAGQALGVCTSSATVGHSLSFGRADAVCVAAANCPLADAAATALANRVKDPESMARVLDLAGRIPGVIGAVAVCGSRCAAWGDVEIVALEEKRG
jgi:ApbE superfamily uncharacterized protein (UPF0280 family)